MFYIAVYIVIGNSDNKLTQKEWSEFCEALDEAIMRKVGPYLTVHGEWYSEPSSAYQNACWSVEIKAAHLADALKTRLSYLAKEFKQDSIVWAVAPNPEFIQAAA